MTTETRAKKSKFRATTLLVGLVVIALAIWACVAFRYDFIPKRFGVVVPDVLYRSGQLSPRMIRPTLEQHKIQVVIDFQGSKDTDPAQVAEQQACSAMHITHYRFPLAGDGTGDISHYADALAAIAQAQRDHKPVLMHCSAGTQRTGAATVFYRLLIQRASTPDAYDELLRYGADPHKKDAVLIQYVNGHMRELAQMLVDRHVIDAIPDPLPQLPN